MGLLVSLSPRFRNVDFIVYIFDCVQILVSNIQDSD